MKSSKNLINNIPIKGKSMHPWFKEGDFPEFDWDFKKSDLRHGDIVLIRPESEKYLIAHRVVSIKGDQINTKGDRSLKTDSKSTVITALVTGRKRGDEIIHWGAKGHKFKRVFSTLSKYNERTSNLILVRLKRGFVIILMKLIYFFEILLYKMR